MKHLFQLISNQEIIDITRRDGIFLTLHQHKYFLTELYAYDNFFVEIWYCKVGNKLKIKARYFRDTVFLEHYLDDQQSFAILKNQ